MGYIKAEQILPDELIKLIQHYVDGQNIYIPRKNENKCKWGANTGIKQELAARNKQIYVDYLEGIKLADLACKYYLSEKSIQRIIRNQK